MNMKLVMRILLVVTISCSAWPLLGGSLSLRLAPMPIPTSLTVEGYFSLSEDVVQVLRHGSSAERLAYDILYKIWREDIRADDVLSLQMSFARRARQVLANAGYSETQVCDKTCMSRDELGSVLRGEITPDFSDSSHSSMFRLVSRLSDNSKQLRKELEIEEIFQRYRRGIAEGLLPPLPSSVTYTFAHLEHVFQQEAEQAHNSWYARLAGEQNLAEKKITIRLPDDKHASYQDDYLVPAIIIAKQAEFLITGEKDKYRSLDKNDPYRVFDDDDEVKGVEPLSVLDISEKLGLPPSYILRAVTDNSNYVHTTWGIFPLHFFLNDAVKPNRSPEVEWDIMYEITKIPEHEWPHSSHYDSKIANLLQSRGLGRANTRRVTALRNSYFGEIIIKQLLQKEDPLNPLTTQDIVKLLREKADVKSYSSQVNKFLRAIGVPPAPERKRQAIQRLIAEGIGLGHTTNQELLLFLHENGVVIHLVTLSKYRPQ